MVEQNRRAPNFEREYLGLNHYFSNVLEGQSVPLDMEVDDNEIHHAMLDAERDIVS